MGELSIHFCEDSVDLAEDSKLLGKIPLQALNGGGLAALKRENQLRMGTVYYQSWLSGVMSGVVLLFGPPELVEVPVESSADNGTSVPITVDGILPVDPTSVALASSQQNEPSQSEKRLESVAAENSASPAPTP